MVISRITAICLSGKISHSVDRVSVKRFAVSKKTTVPTLFVTELKKESLSDCLAGTKPMNVNLLVGNPASVNAVIGDDGPGTDVT